MSTYKPSEHDGLKEDGTPDKRMNPEHGFGGDHEKAVEEGKKGGKSTGTGQNVSADAEVEEDADDSGDYK